jgi:hypothetical protein
MGTRLLNLSLQIFALLLFTVLPAFVTTLAPVTASSIKLQRADGRVTAVTKRYMFFIIPFRTALVDPVTGIGRDTRKGSVTVERRSGYTDKYRKADDQGYLTITGPGVSSVIPADAKRLEASEKQLKAFLQDPQSSELEVYLLGNPLFSLVFGGGATVLTLFVVVLLFVGLIQSLLKRAGIGKVKPK